MNHPVKHFHSGMAAAPVLNGSAGALLAVLDACLVTGFNLLILDSLAITDGVLTGTKAGHGFKVDQVIMISGAGQTNLNGEWLITTTNSNSFSAAAIGIENTVGTGTISAKAAPAGWEKAFAGVNKAVYRSLAPESTGFYLRVDDATAAYARVVGYESMTDIDTGVGAFPTAAQVAGGAYWRKSYGGTTTSRDWTLIADDKAFYIISATFDAGSKTLDYFGDFISNKAGDGYNCALTGYNVVPNSYAVSAIGWSHGKTPDDSKLWIARSFSQLGSAIQGSTCSMTGWNSGVQVTGSETNLLTYPSPVDNGLIVVDNILMDGAVGDGTNAIRGALPGLYFTPQRAPMSHRDPVRDVDGLPDRVLMMIDYYCTYSVKSRCAIDISGAWYD